MSQRGLLVALPALVLAACSPDASVGAVTGTFYGDLTIGHDDPSKSVFASAQLVVDGSGDLGTSIFTTKHPTHVIGEVAATTGLIDSLGGTQIDVTLEVAFPTLGVYTATGNGMYFDQTGNLSAQLTTRDGTGAVIGMTILNVREER